MRKKIVAGNWKMNTTVPEGVELAKNVLAGISGKPSDVMLILGVPFTHITKVADVISGSGIGLAAQNCADRESGAYTGEVSAAMLRSAGSGYVILGHSERRQYYGETDEKLVQKMALAMKEGLIPILCVGETLAEREAGKHFSVVDGQIRNVLYTVPQQSVSNVIVAYEPVWAIGTGKTASADQAQELLLQPQRRQGQLIPGKGLRISGKHVEHRRRVLANGLGTGHHADVRILLRRGVVIVSGSQMDITADAVLLPSHHQGDLAVGL